MVSPARRLLFGVKKLIRPLIPDWVMSRYRLAQLSRHSRLNLDAFVPDKRSARRWLAVTPDTHRARLGLPTGSPPTEVQILRDQDIGVGEERERQALQILADPEIAAAVIGEVADSQIAERKRGHPEIAPWLIAVRDEVLEEIGGIPPGPHPLPGFLARIRDAGHRLGLIPVDPGGAFAERRDPINAPSVVILAAVPLHDVGGGARSSQLAFELLRQGFHVTVAHFAEAMESVDLGLRFIHPRLEQHRADAFDAQILSERARDKALALVEAPFGSLVHPARNLQEAGWPLAYDIIDDWSDPALGGGWYEPGLEEELMRRANSVFASAPDLVERARRMGREATLVPNAVNAEVFGGDPPERPADLPHAGTVLGYHGSLYGSWFDWEALRRVAESFPDAAVVVIGDDRVPRPSMPENVHFLGLKPQRELPGYLQRFDVGMIPFKVNDTTHAVSPLKAYESLASGVPVAAPPLRALQDLDGIYFNDDLMVAVKAALEGTSPDRAVALEAHSWEARVGQLGLDPPENTDATPLKVVHRRAVHYPQGARLVT